MSTAPDIADVNQAHGPKVLRAAFDAAEPMRIDPSTPENDQGVSCAAISPWEVRAVSCEVSWFTTVPPRRDWLLRDARTGDGVLPLGKVGLLLAEGGLGKTMVLIQLAIAMATGVNWIGTFTMATAGRTLVILGEEDPEEAQRRAYNAVRAHGGTIPAPGSIVVIPLAGVPCAMVEKDERGNLMDSAFLVWLRAYLATHGPFALVLIDPLSRFAGADAETDNASATRFIQACESIASEFGATVIVAHHVNKAARAAGAAVTGASARGSSAIYDGCRWAVAMSAEKIPCDEPETAARLGELVTLTNVKSNYSRKCDPVLLRRDLDNGGALLALDSMDLETVNEARASSNPTAQRQAAREEHGRAHVVEVAEIVATLLRRTPGLSGRTLQAEVIASRGACGRPLFDAAMASLGDRVRTEAGPRGATLHYLSEA